MQFIPAEGDDMLALRERYNVSRGEMLKKYTKMIIDGSLYCSIAYTRQSKRNNHTVLLRNGIVANVLYFLAPIESTSSYAIVRFYRKASVPPLNRGALQWVKLEHIREVCSYGLVYG